MVDTTLFYLTYIVIILLLGLLCTVIAKKLKITKVLLLILTGIALSRLSYKGSPLITFSPLFLTTIGTLALVMIVFDATSRIRFKAFDSFSIDALKVVLVFLILNLIILTPFIMLIAGFKFNVYYLILSMIFAASMSGTDAASVLGVLKGVKNRVTNFLEEESLLNTPIMVLIPFVLLSLIANMGAGMTFGFTEHLIPFITQVVTGIGVGVLIGMMVFKIMRKYYSEELSPLAVITSALLTYILAENLGGNGVLAVTALGLIFGSIYVKQKYHLLEFSSIFSNSLEIFVFVLLGFVITLPLSASFFIKSLTLFIIYIGIRYLALHLSFKTKYKTKEKIFMVLTMPKGIALAVVAFTLASYNLEGMNLILNYTLMFILYTIILASVIAKLSPYFIKTIPVKKQPQK